MSEWRRCETCGHYGFSHGEEDDGEPHCYAIDDVWVDGMLTLKFCYCAEYVPEERRVAVQ